MKKTGFTLLEILIVLAIVGIMSAVVVLNVNSPSYSSFMAESRKLAATLSILADEAVYTNSVVVCEPEQAGIYCQTYKNGEWKDLNIRKLVSWAWPKNFTIKQVYINGMPIKDGERIKFFANGDQPPVSLQVTNGKYNAWIDGNIYGDFEVSN